MTPDQRAAALRLAEHWDWLRKNSSKPDDYPLSIGMECAALLRELAAETVQEPVAWIHHAQYLLAHAENSPPSDKMLANGWVPLYANPQQRKPLTDSDLLRLARRCLWLAYVWNDHNFQDPPHKYAQDEARALGIDSFEDANYWLEATHAEITGEQK